MKQNHSRICCRSFYNTSRDSDISKAQTLKTIYRVKHFTKVVRRGCACAPAFVFQTTDVYHQPPMEIYHSDSKFRELCLMRFWHFHSGIHSLADTPTLRADNAVSVIYEFQTYKKKEFLIQYWKNKFGHQIYCLQ